MNKARRSRGPWMWPLTLAAVGVVLLLHNFLLLGDFNVINLWPLLLVVAGAQVLLRGDLVPSDGGRTFGITRGSVESATLEVSAGEIDVDLRALQSEGRLIAGQYASQSRPALRVVDTHAYLKMNRGSTSWLSFADWQLGLARDLPWQVFITSHLGQVNLDLSGLVIEEAVVASGIGDISLVCPHEAFQPLILRSALGNVRVVTPPGSQAQIIVDKVRFLRIHVDESRYQYQDGVYTALDADEEASPVEVHVSGTFGDVYLS